jgi:hypothetical protein
MELRVLLKFLHTKTGMQYTSWLNIEGISNLLRRKYSWRMDEHSPTQKAFKATTMRSTT